MLFRSNSPYITVYAYNSGFSSKYSNPATTPTGIGYKPAFNPSQTVLAVAHATSPYVTAYPWSGSGFGSKYSNPSALLNNTAYGVSFDSSGNNIAVSSSSATLGVAVYPWSSGFGTKYADPSPTVTGCRGLAFR